MEKPRCIHEDTCYDYDYECNNGCKDYENVYEKEIMDYMKDKRVTPNEAMKDLFLTPMVDTLNRMRSHIEQRKQLEDKINENENKII
jgi:hypothetical protein